MSLDTLYWREPLWLLAAGLPLLAALVTRLWQRRVLQRLADPGLLPWVHLPDATAAQTIPRLLLLTGWAGLCIAMAGPRTPLSLPPEAQANAATVVFVMDLSASMLARDDQTARIRHARQAVMHWLDDPPPGLRAGLVVYAGHGHAILSPGPDLALARYFVDQLADLRLPTLGNNLAQALDLAATMLRQADRPYLLLLSDGDLGATAADRAGTAIRKPGHWNAVHVTVVGVGGNEAVTVPSTGRQVMRVNGKQVLSRRKEPVLQQLAAHAQGAYLRLEDLSGTTLAEVLNLPPPAIDGDSEQVHWQEWFFVPLLGGMLLILLGLRPGTVRRTGRQGALGIALTTVLGACQLPGDATPADAIQTALRRADYAQVRQLAANAPGFQARFALGVACYRLADYDCAAQAFAESAWIAPDDDRRGLAVFNLGNSYFALADYRQASVLFRDAELLGVSTTKTRINREFADSLAAAVQQQIEDIAETERRALWRAEAADLPDRFRDRVAEGITLTRPKQEPPVLRRLSPAQLNQLVKRGARVVTETDNTGRSRAARSWVGSAAASRPAQDAGLLNRLLPMEIGLPVAPAQPLRIDGQRPW